MREGTNRATAADCGQGSETGAPRGARAPAVAAALACWLAAALPAQAGIVFTNNAKFTVGGSPTVLQGAGQFANTTGLINTAKGLALSNGTWTYTAAAADANKLVKINFAAQ